MRDEILEILKVAAPDIDFETADSLTDDGVLDSLTIFSIISELSVEYDIKFGFEDLEPENFNSLDTIVALVERKLG